jgi:hypothetical protein
MQHFVAHRCGRHRKGIGKHELFSESGFRLRIGFWLSLTSAHAGESKLACERLWGQILTYDIHNRIQGRIGWRRRENHVSVGAEAYFPSWWRCVSQVPQKVW